MAYEGRVLSRMSALARASDGLGGVLSRMFAGTRSDMPMSTKQTSQKAAPLSNGNGEPPKSAAPAPIWEGHVHFHLASAEATMVLPAETRLDVNDILVPKNEN